MSTAGRVSNPPPRVIVHAITMYRDGMWGLIFPKDVKRMLTYTSLGGHLSLMSASLMFWIMGKTLLEAFLGTYEQEGEYL